MDSYSSFKNHYCLRLFLWSQPKRVIIGKSKFFVQFHKIAYHKMFNVNQKVSVIQSEILNMTFGKVVKMEFKIN